MIHQLIFAYPRPGMSEADFQDYWLNKHAVNFASKIPQIRKYLVDTRIALPGESVAGNGRQWPARRHGSPRIRRGGS
jgi:hypothetical protein